MSRFTTALFDASIANGAILLSVGVVPDVVLATSNAGFLIPGPDSNGPALNRLAQVAAVGTNLTRAQLTSYSLRQKAPYDMSPVNVGTAIESPARLIDYTENPLQLRTNEELDASAVQSNAGAQRATVAVWLADGPLTPIKGDIFTMHWTATATLAANGWTQTAIVFDNGLPQGQLAIVGADFFSAGGLFARIAPRTGGANRPGGFCSQARDSYNFPIQRMGNMGEWMRFQNTQPPQVEFFSRSADTTEEGYFDMMIVG
jgi:hypothetical protein